MLFNDLLVLYEDLDKSLSRLKNLLSSALEKKEYKDLSIIDGDFNSVKLMHTKIKRILKDNCQKELTEEIAKYKKVYEKEHDYAVSAWQSYGSELAGDFNSGEVKAQKKLTLLKDILK
jgi:hypothetical protein